MQGSNFSRGREVTPSPQERRQEQSKRRMEDVNASTRPGDVTLEGVRRGPLR